MLPFFQVSDSAVVVESVSMSFARHAPAGVVCDLRLLCPLLLLTGVDRLDIGIWETERFAMRPGARTSFHLRMLNLGDRLIFVLKFLTSLFSFERLPYIIGVEVFHLGVFLVSKGSYLVREARNVIIEAIPLERALVCTFSCCSKYFYHQW